MSSMEAVTNPGFSGKIDATVRDPAFVMGVGDPRDARFRSHHAAPKK
jgi:hypothetical protein